MRKTRAIIKRSDEPYGHMTNISTRLENLQKLVGGYIEAVTLKPGLVILCNEEGKVRGLPFNMTIQGEPLVGDIVVIGTEGEEFGDIPIEFAEWKEIVKRGGSL
jgi:hypothetical protein